MFPNKGLQTEFWTHLIDLCPLVNIPWTVIGDFNNILALAEKQGGIQLHTIHMSRFMNFVNTCGLIDLQPKGSLFSWWNKQQPPNNIYERLDRALPNSSWLNRFPLTELSNLPISGSDHGLILLSFHNVAHTRSKCFKYEAMWLQHPTFLDIVKQVWNTPTHGSSLQQFLTHVG